MSALKFAKQYRLLLAASGLAALFWVADSAFDGIFFENTSYFGELWPSDPKELWMRCLLVVGVLLFGVFAQVNFSRQEQARQRLSLPGSVLQQTQDGILERQRRPPAAMPTGASRTRE